MKKSLKNIDLNKVKKIVVIGTIVIIVLVGSVLVLHGHVNMIADLLGHSGEIIKEGANFNQVIPNQEIIKELVQWR